LATWLRFARVHYLWSRLLLAALALAPVAQTWWLILERHAEERESSRLDRGSRYIGNTLAAGCSCALGVVRGVECSHGPDSQHPGLTTDTGRRLEEAEAAEAFVVAADV